MKLKAGKLISSFILIIIVITAITYKKNSEIVVLELGIFAGSNWDVPSWQSYRIYDEAIAEFERRFPNIKIKYRSGTLKSDYSEWLAQKIVKGKEPDVFAVLSSDFNTLASVGILKNIDSLVERDDNFEINDMFSNSVKLGQLNGLQYALPFEVSPILMFVNKTLLQNENIPVPENNWAWSEFYDICKKVTKDTSGDGIPDQFGTMGFTWKHAVYTNGQQLFNQNGTKAMFNSPDVLESMKFIKKLNDLNKGAKQVDFGSGKVAFSPLPFSTYRAYKYYPYKVKVYSSFEWECIKLPKGPNGKNASELVDFSMAISSRTKHTKEAWAFLKFMTSDDANQLNVFKYSHGVPVLSNIVESDEAESMIFENGSSDEKTIDASTLSQIIEESIVAPRFQKYDKAMDMADKEIFRMINNNLNLEDALMKFNREIENYLRN